MLPAYHPAAHSAGYASQPHHGVGTCSHLSTCSSSGQMVNTSRTRTLFPSPKGLPHHSTGFSKKWVLVWSISQYSWYLDEKGGGIPEVSATKEMPYESQARPLVQVLIPLTELSTQLDVQLPAMRKNLYKWHIPFSIANLWNNSKVTNKITHKRNKDFIVYIPQNYTHKSRHYFNTKWMPDNHLPWREAEKCEGVPSSTV